MKQIFLKDIADIFKAYVYEDNQKVIPTSALITIFNPGGTTELVSGAGMGVAADGLLSYTLSADNNDTTDENYRAVISYIVGGTTFSVALFYDVVHSKLHKVITDEDIVNELPQLRDNGWREHGTAESGTATTIVDPNLNHFSDDHFTGGLAYSIDKDETRRVTDFVGSTGTVTTEAFSAVIGTDKYILIRSYTKEIQRAFEKIEDLLVSAGRRPDLILDSSDLRGVHILFATAEVCKGMVTEDAGMWFEFMSRYENKAEKAFNKLNLKYDESDDGVISNPEESKRFSTTAGRN